MNAPFNPVDFIHRLESEGIARGAAEAIAQGIEDRNRELATKGDLDRGMADLRNDLDRNVADLKGEIAKAPTRPELEAALARQTVQFGAIVAAGAGLLAAIAG